MSDTLEITVASMPHAHVSPDASEIQLEFEGVDGDKIKLSFDSDKFEELSTQAIQLFTLARNQNIAIGDHLAIQAVEVVDTSAEAPAGGGKVILGLRGDTGIVYSFSILPGKADRLRKSLYDAARSARKQTPQSSQ